MKDLDAREPEPMTPDDFNERCIEIANTVGIAERAQLRGQLVKDGRPVFRAADIDALVAQLEQAVRDQQGVERAERGEVSGVGPEWFVLRQSTKVRICHMAEGSDRLNGKRRELRAYSKADFELAVANVRPIGRAAEDFLTNPDRPEYADIVCEPDPQAVPHGALNIYQGWAIDPVDGDATPLLNHIREVICSNNAALYDYVCKALAHTVQRAGDRLGAMVTLIGDEGAGKGIFLNVILDWFGQHGYRAGNSSDLIGQFNKHLLDCLLVVADEAFFAGDKRAADALKGLVTEARLSIEAKFMDKFAGPNRLTIWASTNHEHAVRMDAKDRRNMPINVSSCRVGDKEYFRGLGRWLDDEGGKAIALHHFLNKVDITGFSPQADRPFTEAAIAQKEATLEDDFLFWHESISIENWRLFGGDAGPDEQGGAFRKGAVYECYLKWHAGTHRRGNPVTESVFWRNFSKWGVTDPKQLHLQFKQDDGTTSARYANLEGWQALGVMLEGYLSGENG